MTWYLFHHACTSVKCILEFVLPESFEAQDFFSPPKKDLSFGFLSYVEDYTFPTAKSGLDNWKNLSR